MLPILCKDCLFWHTLDTKEGECRIHPPRHLGNGNRGVWPTTIYNQGCGDAVAVEEIKDARHP